MYSLYYLKFLPDFFLQKWFFRNHFFVVNFFLAGFLTQIDDANVCATTYSSSNFQYILIEKLLKQHTIFIGHEQTLEFKPKIKLKVS